VGADQGGALSTAMPALELRGVAAGYGAAAAVSGIDLAIGAGEVFCLLGGSGSGKTTLLRCIGGFLAPSSGIVRLNGEDVTDLPPHRRDLTTLFQSYALFPHMNVAENIGFGLRRRGMRPAETRQRVDEMLALVRLEGMGGRRVTHLSGGQQQRVALARCLAPRPRLLLLDEPLSALDPELRAATRADLVAVLRGQGITAVLVTHDRGEALAVADRIGLLQAGRLVQTGTPEDLFERPINRFVAGFLGDVVLLDAVVRGSGAETRLEIAQGVALAGASDHRPGTKLTLGLRPERLRVVAGGGVNAIQAVVEGLTYAGPTLEVAMRLPCGAALRMVRAAELPRPMPGESIWVGWDAAAVLLLPA
jgi:ABC-type Fe3+/spermidine/putrescine transport system ATPase subunit